MVGDAFTPEYKKGTKDTASTVDAYVNSTNQVHPRIQPVTSTHVRSLWKTQCDWATQTPNTHSNLAENPTYNSNPHPNYSVILPTCVSYGRIIRDSVDFRPSNGLHVP